MLNNMRYDSSGTYTQTLTTRESCDSVINLNLLINIPTSNSSVSTCTSYKWNGRLLVKSGAYNDTLQTSSGCDSIVRLNLKINRLASIQNIIICAGQSYNRHTTAGNYTDTLQTINGCDSIVTLHLTVLNKPAPTLGADAEVCAGDSITLNPGIFQSYTWQDGSTGAAYVAKKAGLYSVVVSNTCGTGGDEVKVTEGICKTYFPNVFSPNGDGKNDKFILLNPYNLAGFHLRIYNRYGQTVFETTDYAKPWLGMYKGVPAVPGTYVWYSEFNEAGVSKQLKGTVLLLK
jgi:gliding motility-associated-like protein